MMCGKKHSNTKHQTDRMDHHLVYYSGADLGLWKRHGIPPNTAVVEIIADELGVQ